MINDLDQRESKVMDFIQSNNKVIEKNNSMMNIQSSPEVKMRTLNNAYKNSTSTCLDTMLGSMYRDALPMNDPKKNCSIDDAREEIHDFIGNRTCGKNAEYYIREAIKRTNSSTLKSMLEEAVKVSKECYNEKAKDIGKLSIADLNFNPNLIENKMDTITKNLELDEISDIIRNNVQKTIQDEQDKAKREEEYNSSLEDALANDPNVQDEASMESAMQKLVKITQPTVYQPSLFESIMLGKANIMTESTGEDIFNEAVHEYTKLNLVKALKLESFNLTDMKKLSNSYLK